ncbi:response regulator [Oleiharenicola sp. Vm1]|uniref:response regulator n=1 Tax=Oleiharenicola sp. Vm1 TaxID=3398393 RepID=UPI0039F55F6D
MLVADDHEPNRVLLLDLLQPLGFDLVTAADGEEAVRVARETRPHLALLDVRMPNLDGLAAARRIRDELGDAAPVAIAISASAHDQQHANALAAGCVAFLAKPFKDEELFALIGRHLGLTWKLSDAAAPGETAAPFPTLPFPPAPAQADQLFELASSGDVAAVRAFAQKLAAEDPRLAAFAAQVTELAARFKMKAIRSLVSRYREPPPA